jgi:hypothetical protein
MRQDVTRIILKWFIQVTLIISVFFHTIGYTTETDIQVPEEKTPKEELSTEKKWGITILGIRLTANGYLLDFRYRVNDPDKASPLFSRQLKPFLVDQATGAKFFVPNPPKVGSLRATRKPEANRNYFILFANPAGYVKKGNKVKVIVGDFKAEDLIVK